MKNKTYLFFLIFPCLLFFKGSLHAQTVMSYEILSSKPFILVESRNMGNFPRSKKFSFILPANYVKGTNLARPLLVIESSDAFTSSNTVASYTVITVNGNSSTKQNLNHPFRTGGDIITRTLVFSGNHFKVGTNQIELFQGKTGATIHSVTLYFQINNSIKITPVK